MLLPANDTDVWLYLYYVLFEMKHNRNDILALGGLGTYISKLFSWKSSVLGNHAVDVLADSAAEISAK